MDFYFLKCYNNEQKTRENEMINIIINTQRYNTARGALKFKSSEKIFCQNHCELVEMFLLLNFSLKMLEQAYEKDL